MIYTVTLNPAIDKVLFLDEFQRCRTTRLTRSIETIGGKGTHVSINLKLQGVQSSALGISLGGNGRKISSLLSEWGVDVCFLQYDIPGMESRTNYEIVENTGHHCTMLTERGPLLPKHMTDDLLRQIERLVKADDSLVLTGDASNVEDHEIYSNLTQAAKNLGAKVFLDASGPYLKEGLASRPFLIKPNLEELCFLAGRELNRESDIITALRDLDEYGIPMIAMTWGGNGSIFKTGPDIYRVHPIPVEAINEGGCGDAFLSAIIAGIENHSPVETMLAMAAAVSASAAESEITAGFDPVRAGELAKRAVVEKIG